MSGSEAPVDARVELLEEREFLLRSLADLEAEHAAGDLDDADHARLRDAYTARAAEVLRALEAADGAAAPAVGAAAAAATPPVRRRRRGRTAVVAGVTLAAALGAGAVVAGSAGDRLDGQGITGSITSSTPQMLSEARLLQSVDPVEAIKRYGAVLEVDPDNAEALTYRGWLLVQAGIQADEPDLATEGEEHLDRAIAADPAYPDVRAFKGIVLLRLHDDPVGATASFQAFLANDPPPTVRALVEGVVTEAAARAEAATSPTSVPAG